MKTTLIVGAVLAASQCMPEPSDPVGSTGAPSSPVAEDVGVPSSDTGTADAGVVATAPTEAAAKLLKTGPAPFTVPTEKIPWPQQQAVVLAPQGTRIEGDGQQALVILGEGHNFAFHVAPASDEPLPGPLQEATVVEREDAAQVWYWDQRWFFAGTFGAFSCWNDSQAKHDRDDVEMMIASCKSITQGSAQ